MLIALIGLTTLFAAAQEQQERTITGNVQDAEYKEPVVQTCAATSPSKPPPTASTASEYHPSDFNPYNARCQYVATRVRTWATC